MQKSCLHDYIEQMSVCSFSAVSYTHLGQFQITQGKASEVAEKSKQYDLVISTTVLGGECHCPLIIGTPFLLGRGTEPIVDQIVEVLQK